MGGRAKRKIAKRTVRRFVARDEGGGVIRFTEEELNNISELERGPNYIEVTCGCTNKKYGDYIGKLRISSFGHFKITCTCSEKCKQVNLTPYAFEKHSGREGAKNWKKHIWVIINDKKVALSKTVLISYYKHSTNMVLSRPKQFHRDEFISCSDCKKLRRFLLRDQVGCRTYHDALANKNWKCTDWPYDKISCDDEEERECRKICKGCPRSSTCRGCTSCVCFGCTRCRFWDCDCRTCVDFMEHGEP
ncbi:protein ULTRAPETALA 2 [Quercus suber]|uniref:protein ULTRAPETALA 2 n=1 Tax=Quercus suber TaxID=58331 RepID=UPI0032DE3933